MSRPDVPIGITARDDFWGTESADTHRARRVFLFVLMGLLSAVVGFNLVFFPPLFLFGALFGLGAVVAIFARPWVGLLVYSIVFILRPGEIWPVLAALRVERIIGAVTLVAMFMEMYRREGRLRLDGSLLTRWLFFFLLAVYLSVPFSYWPGLSLDKVVEVLKVIAFYLMVVHLVDRPSRLRWFVAVYLTLIGYIGASSFIAYLQGQLVFAQGIERAAGLTSAGGDPNALGGTLGSTLPLALLFARSVKSGRLKLLLWGLAAVLVATISVTGSRSSVLGVLASLVVLWWYSRNRFLTGLMGLLLVVGVFVALPQEYKERYGTMTESHLDGSSRFRILTWEAGFHMMLDRPLTGVGAGAFSVANAERYALNPEARWLQPHSLYVEVPAEIGLIGTIGFFAFLITSTVLNRRLVARLRRRRRDVRFETTLLDAIFAGTIFLFVFSVFGHTMFRFTWYLYAAMTLVVFRLYRERRLGRAGPAAPAD